MRKRTVRRVWRTDINPIQHAMHQASLLTIAEWNEQMAPVKVAVEALSQGNWDTRDNWQPMFEALNRIESMLKLRRMPDNGFINEAQDVFVAALGRFEATGAKAFRSDELSTLRDVAMVYGNLLKEITHAQLQATCDHTYANTQRIKSQKSAIDVAGCLIERRATA